MTLSRSHPSLVKKLFALEVPEIADGTVEIAAIAREAGHRTKIAVRSTAAGVNAKGACIGPMGPRVRAVMSELHGEKIDIIDWSDDPASFVGNALSPAKALRVEVVDAADRDRPGHRAGLPALARDRPGGAERPARGPADRVADRHPSGHRARRRRRRPPAARRRRRRCHVRRPPRRTGGIGRWRREPRQTSAPVGHGAQTARGRLRSGTSRDAGAHLCGLPEPRTSLRVAAGRRGRATTLVSSRLAVDPTPPAAGAGCAPARRSGLPRAGGAAPGLRRALRVTGVLGRPVCWRSTSTAHRPTTARSAPTGDDGGSPPGQQGRTTDMSTR